MEMNMLLKSSQDFTTVINASANTFLYPEHKSVSYFQKLLGHNTSERSQLHATQKVQHIVPR
jgi:hypothetical protein